MNKEDKWNIARDQPGLGTGNHLFSLKVMTKCNSIRIAKHHYTMTMYSISETRMGLSGFRMILDVILFSYLVSVQHD